MDVVHLASILLENLELHASFDYEAITKYIDLVRLLKPTMLPVNIDVLMYVWSQSFALQVQGPRSWVWVGVRCEWTCDLVDYKSEIQGTCLFNLTNLPAKVIH